MAIIEMYVNLKVPDNEAITAYNTLKKLGYHGLKAIDRMNYYNFEISGDSGNFKDNIITTDILVNPNKHKSTFILDKNKTSNSQNKNLDRVDILIQNQTESKSLLYTLKNRLGFNEILNVSNGVIWSMYFDKECDSRKLSLDITKNLLMNENFQKYKILKKNG